MDVKRPGRGVGPSRASRLLIVDDHELARIGLVGMLAGEPDLEVAGEASTGREAILVCRRIRPDLVLMDLRMPDLDGIAATRLIRKESPATAVVIVTIYENPAYYLEAIKAGAAGYILKGSTRVEIIAGIRQVLRGETLLQPMLAEQLLHQLAAEPTADAPTDLLTDREREVLALMVRGRTNPDIAVSLYISLSTVKVHVQHIIAKLGVADRTQAAVRAIELGLVSATHS